VVDDILLGARGCGTSQGVVVLGVVAFVVDSFIDVVIIVVVGSDTAIGIVMVVVVSCVVLAVRFCMCDIVVIGVAVVISRGTWGEALGLGRRRINSWCKASNSDKKTRKESGSSIAGESLAALESAVTESFCASLVLVVETPKECANCRNSV